MKKITATYAEKNEQTVFFIVVVGIILFIAFVLWSALTYIDDIPTEASVNKVVTTHKEHQLLLNHSLNNLYEKKMVDGDVHYIADTACNEVYVKACSQLDRLMGANESGKIE